MKVKGISKRVSASKEPELGSELEPESEYESADENPGEPEGNDLFYTACDDEDVYIPYLSAYQKLRGTYKPGDKGDCINARNYIERLLKGIESAEQNLKRFNTDGREPVFAPKRKEKYTKLLNDMKKGRAGAEKAKAFVKKHVTDQMNSMRVFNPKSPMFLGPRFSDLKKKGLLDLMMQELGEITTA